MPEQMEGLPPRGTRTREALGQSAPVLQQWLAAGWTRLQP